MVSCCIPICRSTKVGDSTLSFHRIPSDPLKRERWVEIIKKECDFEPSKNGFLCSLHFTKKCFINGGTGLIKKLSREAYPTLCLADPNNKIKGEKEEVQTDDYSSAEDNSQNGGIKFNTGVKRENVHEDPQLSASPAYSDKHTQTMWFMDYDSSDTAVNIYNAHLSTLDINRINCSPFIKHLLLKTKAEIIENRKKIKALHMHKFRSQKRILQLELMVKNLGAANIATKVTRPKSSCSTMVSDSNTQSDSSPSSSPEVVSSYLLDNIVDYDVCNKYSFIKIPQVDTYLTSIYLLKREILYPLPHKNYTIDFVQKNIIQKFSAFKILISGLEISSSRQKSRNNNKNFLCEAVNELKKKNSWYKNTVFKFVLASNGKMFCNHIYTS